MSRNLQKHCSNPIEVDADRSDVLNKPESENKVENKYQDLSVA